MKIIVNFHGKNILPSELEGTFSLGFCIRLLNWILLPGTSKIHLKVFYEHFLVEGVINPISKLVHNFIKLTFSFTHGSKLWKVQNYQPRIMKMTLRRNCPLLQMMSIRGIRQRLALKKEAVLKIWRKQRYLKIAFAWILKYSLKKGWANLIEWCWLCLHLKF